MKTKKNLSSEWKSLKKLYNTNYTKLAQKLKHVLVHTITSIQFSNVEKSFEKIKLHIKLEKFLKMKQVQ